jgi:hypothetical protein
MFSHYMQRMSGQSSFLGRILQVAKRVFHRALCYVPEGPRAGLLNLAWVGDRREALALRGRVT